MPRRIAILALLVGALLVAGCGGAKKQAADSSGTSLSASTRLVDLDHPHRKPALFSLFNQSQGVARLVLLVSPT